MTSLANLLVFLIALLHVYILVLEMFLWTHPLGLKAFRQSQEQARSSAVLAANQGLYNGFLAAGLLWSLLHENPQTSEELKVFFLGCVAVAGLYGGYSVNRRIFFVQTLPAVIALLVLVI